jgi:hypothetical protein
MDAMTRGTDVTNDETKMSDDDLLAAIAAVPTPRKPNPQKRGRKPTWRDGNLEQAAKLAALGLTDAEMAEFVGVSLRTFMRWKVDSPEFCHALKAGKEVADARVERRLFERAIGYKTIETKVLVIKDKVVKADVEKEHPPDTTACIFWLKNRDPENWREKVDIERRHLFNFIGMIPSEEEWLARNASDPEPLVINQQEGTQWSESSELDDDDADLD